MQNKMKIDAWAHMEPPFELNKRTSGPVNANLISGPSKKLKFIQAFVGLLWFNVPVNNFLIMLGRSFCQYFGDLKVYCSRTLHGDLGVRTRDL